LINWIWIGVLIVILGTGIGLTPVSKRPLTRRGESSVEIPENVEVHHA
jgi:hypothetical protein